MADLVKEPVIVTSKEMEFNYADLALEPYADSNGDSSKLLKDIFNKLNDPEFPREKRVIDRFEKRKGSEMRRLVHISSPLEKEGSRCFGKIALIKNKAPQLWSEKDNIIEELEKEQNKQWIETTNYVINFNAHSKPIIMIEFNHAGPRITDFDFYYKQIAKEFQLAKSLKHTLHLSVNYDQLSEKIENVFDLTVKVKATEVNSTEKANWFKSFKNIREETGFKDIRMEMFYGRAKDKQGKFVKNIIALDFARSIIDWLKMDKKNIKRLADLKMTYQSSDEDEIIDLDFIKNRTTSVVSIPFVTGTSLYRNDDFKTSVGQEFKKYLTTGETSEAPVKKAFQ